MGLFIFVTLYACLMVHLLDQRQETWLRVKDGSS
jgi:hypothetical protein